MMDGDDLGPVLASLSDLELAAVKAVLDRIGLEISHLPENDPRRLIDMGEIIGRVHAMTESQLQALARGPRSLFDIGVLQC